MAALVYRQHGAPRRSGNDIATLSRPSDAVADAVDTAKQGGIGNMRFHPANGDGAR